MSCMWIARSVSVAKSLTGRSGLLSRAVMLSAWIGGCDSTSAGIGEGEKKRKSKLSPANSGSLRDTNLFVRVLRSIK